MKKGVVKCARVAGYVAAGAVAFMIPGGGTVYTAVMMKKYSEHRKASGVMERNRESDLKDLAENFERAEWGRFLNLFE